MALPSALPDAGIGLLQGRTSALTINGTPLSGPGRGGDGRDPNLGPMVSTRTDYDGAGLGEEVLAPTPWAQASHWVDEAVERQEDRGDVRYGMQPI